MTGSTAGGLPEFAAGRLGDESRLAGWRKLLRGCSLCNLLFVGSVVLLLVGSVAPSAELDGKAVRLEDCCSGGVFGSPAAVATGGVLPEAVVAFGRALGRAVLVAGSPVRASAQAYAT